MDECFLQVIPFDDLLSERLQQGPAVRKGRDIVSVGRGLHTSTFHVNTFRAMC